MLSIAIATYNRADILNFPLESLCQQTASTQDYEILVVDNASTDHTRAVVKHYQTQFPEHQIRYIYEPRPGVSVARNRGWLEARSVYIGYVDDDCKLPENWVGTALSIIKMYSPDAFGGPYFAFYTAEKPRWYKDSYRSKGQHVEEFRPLDKEEILYGPNMVFRVQLLQEVGGFSPDYGPKGSDFFYGEEADLLSRIRQRKPAAAIFFAPQLVVYHLVRPEKMRLPHLLWHQFLLGRTMNRLYPPKKTPGLLRVILKLSIFSLWILADSLLGSLFRNRADYPYIQNYLVEKVSLSIRRLGVVYEQWRLMGL